MPQFGNSNVKGRDVSLPFYLVLGRSADLTFTGRYFSRRGFGQMTAFRARPNEKSFVLLNAFSVDDRKGQGGSAVNGRGKTVFSNGFRSAFEFDLVSSSTFRQVFSDDFFTATQSVENSRFFLTRNSGNRSFNVLVSREETFFPVRNVITRSTPTVNFKLTGQRLLDGGLYMDLRASADTLSRSDASLGASGLTERVDLFPEFYFSVPLFQGLRLSPRAGLRETFYSNSLEAFEDGSPRGGSLHRRYAELSLALDGWGLSRVYGSKPGEPQWKHLIEPFLFERPGPFRDDSPSQSPVLIASSASVRRLVCHFSRFFSFVTAEYFPAAIGLILTRRSKEIS